MAAALSWYVPPRFPLVEVLPHVRTPEGSEPVRWFVGFNGRVGRPADEVALGWRLCTRPHGSPLHVVVSTEARRRGHDPDASGRWRAAGLALDGALPWLFGSDPPRTDARELQALTDPARWSPTFVVIGPHRRAAWGTRVRSDSAGDVQTGDARSGDAHSGDAHDKRVTWDLHVRGVNSRRVHGTDVHAGYHVGERTTVAWASVGVDMTAVPLATLTDGRDYALDPLAPHTAEQLRSDWERYLAEIRATRSHRRDTTS